MNKANKCTNHIKIYENKILTSYPPKQRWICNKCGQMGIDTGAHNYFNNYEDLIKQFKKE